MQPVLSASSALPARDVIDETRLATLHAVGMGVLRYGLVFFLLMFGALKFTAFEAEGIQPLIANSPLMSWLYKLLSVQGASNLLGVVELALGFAIASRRWLPRLSGLASLAASGMFMVTLSFLVTTPGVLEPTNPMGGFLMKDLMLLGGALLTAAEGLLASRKATS